MANVEISGCHKYFGRTEILRDISIDIADGEFVVLVGPSGCGKSTLLRMVAGLEEISLGEIRIDSRVVNDVRPKDRDVAMVFQSYALYPHKNVAENMGFSLKLARRPSEEIDRRVREAAAILDLEKYLDRYPKQLSGGQRQRVAMGRAIVRDPKVFLFDEPLSNLDAKLRVQMRSEVKKLHSRLETTSIYVTHDQVEAMTMADRIVVLRDGEIEQIGTPDELYRTPDNIFVAGFIGSPAMNFLSGTARRADGAWVVDMSDGVQVPIGGSHYAEDGQQVICGVRPRHFQVCDEGKPGTCPFQVDVVEPTGDEVEVSGHVGESAVSLTLPSDQRPTVGTRLHLRPMRGNVHLFDANTEKSLRSKE